MLQVLIEEFSHMRSKSTGFLHGENVKTDAFVFVVLCAYSCEVLLTFLAAEASEWIHVLDIGLRALEKVFIAIPLSHYSL